MQKCLFAFGVSKKSCQLINCKKALTSKLDQQCIQVLKEATCHCSEGQRTRLNCRRSIFTGCTGYENELYHERYRYVNAMPVADFNLLSRVFQGDTHRFELIERFSKVRSLKYFLAFV